MWKSGAMSGKSAKYGNFLLSYAIYIILLLIFFGMVVVEPGLLTFRNLLFILSQASTRVILALGVAGIIVLGCTDLSLGRAVGLAGIMTASLLQSVAYERRIFPNMPELPILIPIIGAMLLCAAFAVAQCYFVAKIKVAPFIASLAFQLIIYGAQSIYFDVVNKSSPIGGLNDSFKQFAQGYLPIGSPGIPYLVVYAALATLIIWFIWNKTKLGRNMFAIGGNSEAASVSGINIVSTMTMIYMTAGLLYGFGGSLEAARTGSAANSLGSGYELDAIASCVVGGVSMRGGVGSVGGVVIGVLIFQVISYGLVYLRVNTYVQYLIKGVIILLAVSIDTQKYIQRK
ncbi:galactoside transport system permease protein MglC [Synergistales bacterium]|nr:galactoside transport system permease protein MglC [Synergistales bacterium]